jgi:hypothetical protein
MGWERIAENRIRDAMQVGEFDKRQAAIRRTLSERRTQLAVLLERARRT